MSDDLISKIQGPQQPISTPSVEGSKEEASGAALVDSGLSSIKKSESVIPDMSMLMAIPILSAPANMDTEVFAVASIGSGGLPVANAVESFVLQEEKVKDSVLEGWNKNLKEIQEQVATILNSSYYRQLQEIWQKGDPLSGAVSGVQGATSASAAVQTGQGNVISSLDRLQVLEKVPPSAEVSASSAPAPRDSSQALILPLAAALLAGAGFVVGTQLSHVSNPLTGAVDLMQKLQPILPQVSLQDLIPIINLLAVAPIYYNSWNEAVSNLKSGERQSYVQTAQNFAKDVIKIISDPNFVKNLISKMPGTEKLSPDDQDKLSRMLKIVLIGVSLSLLYSVEVGKVQNGKYGGIEPEELRELILGTWTKPSVPGAKMDSQEELTASLIKRIHEQLSTLSIGDRAIAANMLVEYITQPRDLDPMLDPAKVFNAVLSDSTFEHKGKDGMLKA